MLPLLMAVLIASPTPSPSAAAMPGCLRTMQGAVLGDTYAEPGKGIPPYYAVVEMRLNADDSIKLVRIYKSSGSADYDRDALVTARALLGIPQIAHCEHVESHFYYLHYPSGYAEPQFTPHP